MDNLDPFCTLNTSFLGYQHKSEVLSYRLAQQKHAIVNSSKHTDKLCKDFGKLCPSLYIIFLLKKSRFRKSKFSKVRLLLSHQAPLVTSFILSWYKLISL